MCVCVCVCVCMYVCIKEHRGLGWGAVARDGDQKSYMVLNATIKDLKFILRVMG